MNALKEKTILYNSALTKYHKEFSCKIIEKFTHGNSLAFTHDIFNGLPDDYMRCDVIYSEPFWAKGHKTLKENGKVSSSFKELQEKINNICNSIETPVVLLLGKNALKHYTNYDIIGEVMLHNYPAQVVSWRYKIDIPVRNEKGFLFNNFNLSGMIAKKSNLVGDFLCGFGNTAIACIANNSDFVCSDVDSKCISITKKRIDNLKQ